MDLSVFQKNYGIVVVTVVLGLLVSIGFNLLAGNSLNESQAKKDYIKTILITAVTSALIVYVHTQIPIIEEVILTQPPF